MFDHVGLRVRDVARSARFYVAALKPLGLMLASQDDTGAGLGPPGAPALWLSQAETPSRTHVAFTSRDRASVDAFYKAGLAAGGADNGPPGPRPDYGAHYYAAFLFDPDGNNVEAVCMAEQA